MRPSSLRVLTSSLLALAALAAPSSAAVSSTHQADLRCYRLIGGQPLRVDLRTTLPSTPFVMFFSLNGTPSVVGNLPPIGVNLSAPYFYRFLFTNPAGRFTVTLPTTAGEFGPPLSGLPLFLHAILVAPGGVKIASNVESVQMQPAAPAPGYLVDEAATHLPAGYDQLGGNSIVPVDINRDGFPDLVISNDFEVKIWMNDGQGHFADETAARIAWPGDPPSTVVAGDLDRDGDPDLITGGGYDDFVSPPDRLWVNDGTGHFLNDASFPEGEGLTSQIELADIDRDGDVDVLIANGIETHLANPGGKCALLINDGFAGFLADPAFAAAAWNDPQFEMTGIRAGDVDGDGWLDVYVVRSDTGGNDGTIGQPNVLLHNNAGGGFTDVTATMVLPLKNDNSQDAQLVDLDGDLDLDIVVANSVLGVSALNSGDVYINQGGQQGGIPGQFFDDATSFLEPNNFSDGIRLSVVADDLDADGDADVIVTVHDLFAGADQMLFLNQGAAQGGVEGTFVRQTWFDPTGSGLGGLGDFICWGSCAFDADHDGDRDVILCGNGVVGSDPSNQFTTRFLINHKL
jgi:hypothetical protein